MPDVRCLTALNKSEEQIERFNIASELLLYTEEREANSFVIFALGLEDLTLNINSRESTSHIYVSDDLNAEFIEIAKLSGANSYKIDLTVKYVYINVTDNSGRYSCFASAKFLNYLYPPNFPLFPE